jgi:hypothetical protein
MPTSTAPDHHDDLTRAALELAPSARLPEPLTSFIGREQEVGEIPGLLADG